MSTKDKIIDWGKRGLPDRAIFHDDYDSKIRYLMNDLAVALDVIDESISGSLGLSNNLPNAVGATSAGASIEGSRSDHIHAHGNQNGGTEHTDATSLLAGFMSATDKVKLDGVEANATNTVLSNAVPETLGIPSSGISTSASRADHVHNHGNQLGGTLHSLADGISAGFLSSTDKTKLDTVASGATNTPLSNSNPASLGTASAGISTSASRHDHVHSHGALTDGTLHAAATSMVNGFLSAADKSKLDGIEAGATNSPLGAAFPQGLGTASPGGTTYASREDHVHPSPSGGQNLVFATPSGSSGQATLRALSNLDIPTGISVTNIGTGIISDAEFNYLDGVTSNIQTQLNSKLSGITVGTTSVSSGTAGRVLYDNSGTLGEYPITGTTNVVMSDSPTITTPSINTPTMSGTPTTLGQMGVSTDNDLTYYNGTLTEKLGSTLFRHVRNTTGGTLTKGTVVYVSGFHAGTGYPTVAPARADSFSTSAVFGIIAADISDNQSGYAQSSGLLSLDTSSYSAGDPLYVSAISAGTLTTTPPSSPNFRIRVATVTKASVNGEISIFLGARLLGLGTANQIRTMNSGGTAEQFTSTLPATSGGTGQSSFTTGDLLYASSSTTLNNLIAGTSGYVLTANGAGVAPSYQPPKTMTSNSTSLATASYSLTTNNFEDIGLSITNIAAGTYLVVAEVRMIVQCAVGAGYMVAELYDSTAGAAISNSERIGPVAVKATVVYADTAVIHEIVTLTTTSTLQVRVKRPAGFTYTLSDVYSDSDGRSRLSIVRLA